MTQMCKQIMDSYDQSRGKDALPISTALKYYDGKSGGAKFGSKRHRKPSKSDQYPSMKEKK